MRKILSLFVLLIFSSSGIWATVVPEKPYPPRLVNDYAGMLSEGEANSLENQLVDFSNRTTTQIVLVTLPDLQGEDKAMVAIEIGQKWGVGSANFDNGIVILLKPKTPGSNGEVFIATGYGLEGVIPDAITKRIVENEMIPSFMVDDYYGGIAKAVNTLMQLSLGEFTAKEYEEQTASEKMPPGAIMGIIVVLFIVFGLLGRKTNRMSRGSIGRNLPFWVLMSMMMNSGSRGRGSWGDFSSGKGGFGGGGGGGFGGFGGGSFGGGGAGGSW